MEMKDLLSKIDSKLATPKVVNMNKAAFEKYAGEQIAKAEEEEDKKDKEKAKKRLAHLRSTVAELSKSVWEGTNEKPIPVYEEPNLTASSEKSEKEVPTPPAGNQGGMSDGQSFAAPGGQQDFAKATAELAKAIDGLKGEPAPAATQGAGTQQAPAAPPAFDWPADVNNESFMKEGITKRAADWGLDSDKAAK